MTTQFQFDARGLLSTVSMKACRVHRFGSPEVIALEDVERPKPGAGEVLVRGGAAGVGPCDAWIRAGKSASARQDRVADWRVSGEISLSRSRETAGAPGRFPAGLNPINPL